MELASGGVWKVAYVTRSAHASGKIDHDGGDKPIPLAADKETNHIDPSVRDPEQYSKEVVVPPALRFSAPGCAIHGVT